VMVKLVEVLSDPKSKTAMDLLPCVTTPKPQNPTQEKQYIYY
jgi:hypothetical protein